MSANRQIKLGETMTNPISGQDVREKLASTIFGAVGADALDGMLQVARIEHYKIPTLLGAAGENPSHLRLVLSGHIEIIARHVSGSEIVVGHITSGGWATWLSVFMAQAPAHDFYSSASSSFLTLPIEAVRTFCARHPETYPLIIRMIGHRMRLLMEWTGQSVLATPVQRMAKLLSILVQEQQHASDQLPRILHVTQARLASQARCSRQTANQLLQQLEQEGLIVAGYGQFLIPDWHRLDRFADGDLGRPGSLTG